MKKYIIIFSATYLLATLLIALLYSAKSGGAGINLAGTMAASFLSAAIFSKDHGRAPSDHEISGFAWGSLLASFLISFVLVLLLAGYVLPPQTLSALKGAIGSPVFLSILAFGCIFIGAIYYFVIKWSFSWYARMANR